MTALCHLILAAACAAPAEQRLGDAVGRVDVDRAEVPLSGEVALTLSVEGPAPVEVEPPRPLTQSPDWRVRPAPPRTTPLPNGRERWEQTFRLEPFQAGRVALPLEPLRYRTRHELRDWTLTWPPLELHVTTGVAEPSVGQARGVTGIDELPPVPPTRFPWPLVGVAAGLAVAVAFTLAVLLRRRRAAATPRSPRDRAIDELLRLEAEGAAPDLPQRLADLVRRYFETRLALAATRQTTAEFLAAVQAANALTPPQAARLDELLRRGDLAKFAGVAATPEEAATLLAAARLLVAEPPVAPS